MENRGSDERDRYYKFLALRHAIRHGIIDKRGIFHSTKAKRMGTDWTFIARHLSQRWHHARAFTVNYLEYKDYPQNWKRPTTCMKSTMGQHATKPHLRRQWQAGWQAGKPKAYHA